MHALLAFLAPRLDHVPKVLGFDDRGREALTYLPGTVVDHTTEVLTSGQIRSLVAWTRRFHDVVAEFSHPGPWRQPQIAGATIVCHNDVAPYNACFDGDELAGVFDWDLAGPSTPLYELAFIAWNCVPLWRDVGAERAAERLALIAEAYGGPTPADILAAVPPRIQIMLDWIPLGAAAGDQGLVNLMSCGEPLRSRRLLDDLLTRIPAIAAELPPASDYGR